jgi:hypothetical protein
MGHVDTNVRDEQIGVNTIFRAIHTCVNTGAVSLRSLPTSPHRTENLWPIDTHSFVTTACVVDE